MGLTELLKKNQKAIAEQWFNEAAQTYPAEATKLMNNTDPFANPVGTSTRDSLAKVFEELIGGLEDMDRVTKAIDPVIRMRAVQSFTASQATSVFLMIKDIVRDQLSREIKQNQVKTSELYDFDKQVDQVCLKAFDIFVGCREQIYSYKANFVKSRTMNLLAKADILCEVPEVGTEIIPHDVYKNGGFDNQ